ncbi:MAG TPA: hypothetical protein VHP12_00910 [Chitinophagaceae bacterium]|nr:hypothetical protein [Chitinophagaceae bacterium]
MSSSNLCSGSTTNLDDSLLIMCCFGKDTIKDYAKFNTVLDRLLRIACCKSKYCRTVLDETAFKVLLSLLDVLENREIKYQICTFLYEKRNYNFLKNNTVLVKKTIFKEPMGGTEAAFLLLCELNEDDIKKLRNEYNLLFQQQIPLYARIRFGEKNLEDTLIEKFNIETVFEKMKFQIKQIELAGTKKCKIALVHSLGTKDLIQESSQYSYSIRYFIIEALGRLHPEVALLNDDFQDYISEIEEHHSEKNNNVKLTKAFYEKLYSWIDKKYGIKINELKKADFLYSYELERYYDEK